MNEITCHILETIYARMLHAKSASGAGKTDVTGIKDVSLSSAVNIHGLTVLQSQVLACVRASRDDDGISVAQISEMIRGVPERKIRFVPPSMPVWLILALPLTGLN